MDSQIIKGHNQENRKTNRVTITQFERKLLNKISQAENLKMPAEYKMCPTIKYLRRNSISGKLETQVEGEAPDFFVDVTNRPKTSKPDIGKWCREKTKDKPFNSDRITTAQSRRLTLTGLETVDIISTNLSKNRRASQRSFGQIKIEELLSITHLENLKRLFFDIKSQNDQTGLSLPEFKKIVLNFLNHLPNLEKEVELLFLKIDSNSSGLVTWNQICSFFHLQYLEEDSKIARKKKVIVKLPCSHTKTPHREKVVNIRGPMLSNGNFITCSQDGLTCFWTKDIKLKKAINISNHNSAKRQKCVTDFLLISQLNKVLIASGDRELQFYELSSMEPYCHITSLPTVPLQIDFFFLTTEDIIITYGDHRGCVNIMYIESFNEKLKAWKQGSKVDGVSNISLDKIIKEMTFIQWKVHNDWIQQLRYVPELQRIVSCSSSESRALVIGCIEPSTKLSSVKYKDPVPVSKNLADNVRVRESQDETVFSIFKGCKCFEYSKSMNVMVTGGLDRVVRVWNIYMTMKPVSILSGHDTPIVRIFISETDSRILSFSKDNCLRVWDLKEHTCLLVLTSTMHCLPGEWQQCQYSDCLKNILVATFDCVGCLQIDTRISSVGDTPTTHEAAVHALVVNEDTKHVITASDDSTIKVWDLETGELVSEYFDAHGNYPIQCMVLDDTKKKKVPTATLR